MPRYMMPLFYIAFATCLDQLVLFNLRLTNRALGGGEYYLWISDSTSIDIESFNAHSSAFYKLNAVSILVLFISSLTQGVYMTRMSFDIGGLGRDI